MLKQTDAIKKFLQANTHEDLSELYTEEMEVQVNAAQDNGERVAGEYRGRAWSGWSDPSDPTLIWKSYRIPFRAKTSPEYTPRRQTWPLGQHAEGIGMTGWNWVRRRSVWVAYDFDSIANHSQGLTAAELEETQTVAMSIPWIWVRKSTSGKGFHLYVFLKDVRTENHTEHAAIGRAVLGMLSAKTGFDFRSKVDACGGNMWVWHRKMKGTDGLTLVKKGTILDEIPPNWQDHVEVVRGSRRKNLPRYVEKDNLDDFEELCGTRPRIKLDPTHLAIQGKLDEVGAQWWWDADHWMMVCHTADLKRVHSDLNLRGIFETMATGKEHGADHNCFAFPMRKGAWTLRRYTPGVREHQSWDQDGVGYTRCFYNQEPDLQTAARSMDGVEMEKGGFEFTEAEVAVKVAESLGANIDLPPWAANRLAVLKHHKTDGRLIVEIKREARDDGGDMSGWREEKGWWKRIFSSKVTPITEPEVGNHDELIRHLITSVKDDYGWVINAGAGWQTEPLQHVRLSLKSLSYGDREINNILGNCILRGWTLVNKPFEVEFPGDRQWNRGAAQLRYKPKVEAPFNHPTWSMVLNHTGAGLDHAVKRNKWCQTNGIMTGGEYLKMWVASMFQQPEVRLPYLFPYSEQEGTGKSILHEALSLLMTKGYVEANSALTSSGNFNGELENAVLCYIEEVNLSVHKEARAKMKNWITAQQLSVHHKNRTPYNITNTTHWIQCANAKVDCPIGVGDSRITMVHVRPPTEIIPKSRLLLQLEKEASDFLGAVMDLELPPPNDRLGIDVVETDIKISATRANMTALELFIDEMCCQTPGTAVLYKDFYTSFQNWLDPEESVHWTKIRVGRSLPEAHPKGRNMQDGAKFYVGNICFDQKVKPSEPWILSGDKLVRSKT